MKKNLSQKQVNLIAWIKQKWKTKSGKKSSLTGERYLPEKAIKALAKNDYKVTSHLKIKALKKGKQYSKQPKFIVEQVRKYRNEFKYKVSYLSDKLNGGYELNRIEKCFINKNYKKILSLNNINLNLIKAYDTH